LLYANILVTKNYEQIIHTTGVHGS